MASPLVVSGDGQYYGHHPRLTGALSPLELEMRMVVDWVPD